MIKGARYVHTNLIARDWKSLARFYQDVFGCVPVPPERNLSGSEMEAGTAVPGARLRGMHMRLPGVGPEGPTLEIFEYAEPAAEAARLVNRPGFAHIAFAVDSVSDARDQVLSSGGSPVGEVVTVAISPTSHGSCCRLLASYPRARVSRMSGPGQDCRASCGRSSGRICESP